MAKYVCSVCGYEYDEAAGAFIMNTHTWVSLICSIVTLFVVVICSVYGKTL